MKRNTKRMGEEGVEYFGGVRVEQGKWRRRTNAELKILGSDQF